MRVLIDLQGAQSTGSRGRGIGRYAMSLAEGVIRNRNDHEVLILLSSAFADTIPPIRRRFEAILPSTNIISFDVSGSTAQLSPENRARRVCNERLREAFIASLDPDVVHVSSLFEGLTDDAVISIGRHERGVSTSVTLFDLIPLINKEVYLSDPTVARWYADRLDQLRRADRVLAISGSSRTEAIQFLGFAEDQAVNVGTAADPQFRKRTLSRKRRNDLLKRYGLKPEFVMYTGGIDFRKNIERLIEGFALLPRSARERANLAVVCSCDDADRRRLQQIARFHELDPADVVMTGFVPEDDLIDLYNSCALFIFPSWHEGFGLPALEAMHCGAPVVGSNRSSLPEVIGLDAAMFDPFDVKSIARVLEQGLCDETFQADLRRHGEQHRLNFSWDKSAQIAVKAFEDLAAAKKAAGVPGRGRPVGSRPKLAFVSPLPPQRSGIAQYNVELVPELSAHYEIDCIVPDDFELDPSVEACLGGVAPMRSATDFLSDWRSYERILYCFGNSDYHTHMFDMVRQAPGVVSLHDFFMSGILSYMENHHGIDSAWSDALYRSHGYRALVERAADGGFMDALWKYPSNQELFELSHGAIVHNNWSFELAERWLPEFALQKLEVVPLWRGMPAVNDKERARARLGLTADEYLVCSFGHLGETKLSDRLLEDWQGSELAQKRKCQLIFVGEAAGGEFGKIMSQQLASSVDANVRITGWVDDDEYRTWLEACDAVVQLRTRSRGETSAAVLDAMAYGKPTIVNAHGSAKDLPHDCVMMVPDEFKNDELISALQRLHRSAKLRASLGEKAAKTIHEHHSPRHCAKLYADALEGFYDKARNTAWGVANAIGPAPAHQLTLDDRADLARAIATTYAASNNTVLYLDVTECGQFWLTVIKDRVRELVSEERRIEPINWDEGCQRFYYDRGSTLEALGLPSDILQQREPVTFLRDASVVIFSGEDGPAASAMDRWVQIGSLHNLQIDVERISASQAVGGLAEIA